MQQNKNVKTSNKNTKEDKLKSSQPSILCRYENCPNDTPNGFAHLACRAAYTFIAWFVLGNNILSGQSFFVSITLFVLPLFMDYLKFTPRDSFRRLLKYISLLISSIFVFIGILGLMNVLILVSINDRLFLSFSDTYIVFKGITVPVEKLYLSMLSTCFLTVVDWISNISDIECRNTLKRS